MEIVIYGEPVPQGRPKFASFGGHVHAYDPAKSKNYKQLVRFWVTQYLKKLEGFTPYENALCVDLTFYLGIPTSWSKQKRIQASQGVIRPIGKRSNDADNLCKGVLIAGIDKAEPRAEIQVTTLTPEQSVLYELHPDFIRGRK